LPPDICHSRNIPRCPWDGSEWEELYDLPGDMNIHGIKIPVQTELQDIWHAAIHQALNRNDPMISRQCPIFILISFVALAISSIDALLSSARAARCSVFLSFFTTIS